MCSASSRRIRDTHTIQIQWIQKPMTLAFPYSRTPLAAHVINHYLTSYHWNRAAGSLFRHVNLSYFLVSGFPKTTFKEQNLIIDTKYCSTYQWTKFLHLWDTNEVIDRQFYRQIFSSKRLILGFKPLTWHTDLDERRTKTQPLDRS